ncbi:DNA-directed RNA polymerase subunit L [Striga asiatica]|uniref:DNA-directed RNA polymerase subunit L n=1 Tax=Striga asiatica TaxID=4170 RepID=A0A5A7PX46_STRAF|nr:DNA-directed RNA polymerase subunit L [Striga asiatica]
MEAATGLPEMMAAAGSGVGDGRVGSVRSFRRPHIDIRSGRRFSELDELIRPISVSQINANRGIAILFLIGHREKLKGLYIERLFSSKQLQLAAFFLSFPSLMILKPIENIFAFNFPEPPQPRSNLLDLICCGCSCPLFIHFLKRLQLLGSRVPSRAHQWHPFHLSFNPIITHHTTYKT